MKVIMNSEQFDLGIKEFLKEYYKGNLKPKYLKKLYISYFLLLALFVVMGIFNESKRTYFFTLAGILLGGLVLVCLIFLLSFLSATKQKNKLSIQRVEYKYEEKIYVDTYFLNGSVNSAQYAYEDIKKVAETGNYFFLFISDNNAIPLIKEGIDRGQFIEMMLEKGIVVKEWNK